LLPGGAEDVASQRLERAVGGGDGGEGDGDEEKGDAGGVGRDVAGQHVVEEVLQRPGPEQPRRGAGEDQRRAGRDPPRVGLDEGPERRDQLAGRHAPAVELAAPGSRCCTPSTRTSSPSPASVSTPASMSIPAPTSSPTPTPTPRRSRNSGRYAATHSISPCPHSGCRGASQTTGSPRGIRTQAAVAPRRQPRVASPRSARSPARPRRSSER